MPRTVAVRTFMNLLLELLHNGPISNDKMPLFMKMRDRMFAGKLRSYRDHVFGGYNGPFRISS